jgi:hypothetical protein
MRTAKELGELVKAIETIDLDNTRIRDIHLDGYHHGMADGITDGEINAYAAADLIVFDAYQMLTRQGVSVNDIAAVTFVKLMFDPDHLLDDTTAAHKQELADFIHSWTRRVAVDLYIDPPDTLAKLPAIQWWKKQYSADDLLNYGSHAPADEVDA